MKNEQTTDSAASALSAGVERCKTCTRWHKAKAYDCQYNGPYGGCLIGTVSLWKEKKVRSNAALTGAEGVRVEGTVMQQEGEHGQEDV